MTVLFLAAYVATLLVYQAKQPVDRGDKRIFDVVVTGLILGLGLNFFVVFKDLAKIARWRILPSRYFEVREVVLILEAESLMKMFRLMIQSSLKSAIFWICLVWLLVNIGAQIIVAVLPLYASLRSGYNSSSTTISPGYVTVSKLDCFYRSNMEACGVDRYPLDAARAHTYGKRRTSRDQDCSYQSTDDISKGPQACIYFARKDQREFAVRYADSNPTDLTNAYPYYGAQRIITTAATNCNGSFHVAGPSEGDSADGIRSEYVWQFENSTGIYPLSIPRSLLAARSTTYIWNDTNLPPRATLQACGPRCVVLYALRDMFRGSAHEISIFQCHVTISLMSNTKDLAHELSDDMARTAGASIALSGRWRRDASAWRNFQLYQDGAEWAAKLDDSPEDVGALMAEFAASALATMAGQNPTTIVRGSLPTLGYQTDVEWKNTSAMIASIAAAHLLMVLLILWLARPVIVMDDSYLVRVLLLQGLMKPVSEGEELQPLPETESARGLESTIRVEDGVAENAGVGIRKPEESRSLLKGSARSSMRNLHQAGAILGGNARGSEREEQDSSSTQASQHHAIEEFSNDQSLPERTEIHEAV